MVGHCWEGLTMPLLSHKAITKMGTWNIRTMFESGRTVQVAQGWLNNLVFVPCLYNLPKGSYGHLCILAYVGALLSRFQNYLLKKILTHRQNLVTFSCRSMRSKRGSKPHKNENKYSCKQLQWEATHTPTLNPNTCRCLPATLETCWPLQLPDDICHALTIPPHTPTPDHTATQPTHANPSQHLPSPYNAASDASWLFRGVWVLLTLPICSATKHLKLSSLNKKYF